MISTIQADIRTWHDANYSQSTPEAALLGIGEELGELMRCELKQSNGIRGTFDSWQEEKKKEIGDVLISLLTFSGLHNVVPTHIGVLDGGYGDISDGTTRMLFGVAQGWTLLTELIDGKYAEMTIEKTINAMASDLTAYAIMNGFDITECLEDRWATISKRDFIENPLTGGREKE